MAEYESGAEVLTCRPLVVFLELTRDCNLHCAMCRSSSDSFRGMNMPRDILLEIAEELFPSAALVDLRGWGESTLLRDFGWNVEKALSYGTRLRLVTNALSLRPFDPALSFRSWPTGTIHFIFLRSRRTYLFGPSLRRRSARDRQALSCASGLP
ncbi:hypothetical protein [Frankia sp. Cj5]|uniref:hypothetical protein n=1 Tax=Frankia sp. Cj5 TaxID=2880978 RepID=UPI001EF6D405|nr:hypothetical protein [Frankia sp. Cj5]